LLPGVAGLPISVSNSSARSAVVRASSKKSRAPTILSPALLRKVSSESFIMNGDYTKMAMWLKAIYHDSGVTRTPEETILKAYDTMTGVEKPAFAKI